MLSLSLSFSLLLLYFFAPFSCCLIHCVLLFLHLFFYYCLSMIGQFKIEQVYVCRNKQISIVYVFFLLYYVTGAVPSFTAVAIQYWYLFYYYSMYWFEFWLVWVWMENIFTGIHFLDVHLKIRDRFCALTRCTVREKTSCFPIFCSLQKEWKMKKKW